MDSWFEMVGVLLREHPTRHLVYIESLYSWRVGPRLTGTARQRSFGFEDSDRLEVVMQRATDLWAPVCERVWYSQHESGCAYYIEFVGTLTPSELGLPGDWKVYAQK